MEYNEYLLNKSCIVIGPSGYLKDRRKGSFIDSFDWFWRSSSPGVREIFWMGATEASEAGQALQEQEPWSVESRC